ncbi:MAG: putative two-component system response regulator [Chlamydiales bacterium]|jgi:putative two-component system response regulator
MTDNTTKRRVLFVDDEARILDGLRRMLRAERDTWDMTFVGGVDAALSMLEDVPHDAVVSDINMPGRDGFDLLEAIRANDQTCDIPVVILTGNGERGMKRRALDLGATDLLNKPVDRDELIARIRSVLRLKGYTDEIKVYSAELEERVQARTAELEIARAELVWRLGKAGEFRDSDTGFHVVRVGYYAQCLAEKIGLESKLVREIFLAAPLHDVGKIGIPDRILLKPAKLEPDEWEIMMTHTTIGAEILKAQSSAADHARVLGTLAETDAIADNPFARVGAEIAEAHHERWDGGGYPHRLAGEDIPIAARITAIGDVYDALSSERPYKPAMKEEEVLEIMRKGCGTQFDPEIFAAFEASLPDFRQIQVQFRDEQPVEMQADSTQTVANLLS